MMTEIPLRAAVAERLLADLALRGVTVQADRGKLVINGPRGAIDREEVEALRVYKAEILALLVAPVPDADEDECPCALCQGAGDTGILEEDIDTEATALGGEVLLATRAAYRAINDPAAPLAEKERAVERHRASVERWYAWRDDHWSHAPVLLEEIDADLRRQVRALRHLRAEQQTTADIPDHPRGDA